MITRHQEKRIRALRRYMGIANFQCNPLQSYEMLSTLETMTIQKARREGGWETSDEATLERIVGDFTRMAD